jgi:hypothetical protein
MARNNVLRWLDGRGWLILSGGGEGSSDVRAQALGRLSADGGVAYITLGTQSSLGEMVFADLEDLGAPSGYLVDILSEDDETIQSRLSEAGMIVIDSSAPFIELRSSLMGAAAQGIQTAFENGAVILAEGSAATVLGAWVLTPDGNLVSGLEWLESTLIVPGVVSITESEAAQSVLNSQTSAIAIGIGEGSALALGPDGEVETWGAKQVAVALGRDYTT